MNINDVITHSVSFELAPEERWILKGDRRRLAVIVDRIRFRVTGGKYVPYSLRMGGTNPKYGRLGGTIAEADLPTRWVKRIDDYLAEIGAVRPEGEES